MLAVPEWAKKAEWKIFGIPLLPISRLVLEKRAWKRNFDVKTLLLAMLGLEKKVC